MVSTKQITSTDNYSRFLPPSGRRYCHLYYTQEQCFVDFFIDVIVNQQINRCRSFRFTQQKYSQNQFESIETIKVLNDVDFKKKTVPSFRGFYIGVKDRITALNTVIKLKFVCNDAEKWSTLDATCTTVNQMLPPVHQHPTRTNLQLR